MNISFTLKMSIIITVLITFVTGFGIAIFYYQSKAIIINDIKKRLLNIGNVASQMLEPTDRESIQWIRQKILDESITLDSSVQQLRRSECGDDILKNCPTLTVQQRTFLESSPGYLRLRQKLREVVRATEQRTGDSIPRPEAILDTLGEASHLMYIQAALPQSPKKDVSLVIVNNDDMSDPVGNLYSSSNYKLFGEPLDTGKAAVSEEWYFDEFCVERPCMTAVVPILDESNNVIAIVGLDYQLEHEWGALANLRRNAYIITTVVLVAAILVSILIASMINVPLFRLVSGAKDLQQRNFAKKITMSSRDEFGYLAAILNKMGDEIQQYAEGLEGLVDERTSALAAANDSIVELNKKLKTENESLGADLDVALAIQGCLLPLKHTLNDVQGFEVSCFNRSTDRVSGDFMEVVNLSGRSAICIGHVSEEGLETGIFNFMMHAALHALLLSGASYKRCIEESNRIACALTSRLNMDKHMTLTILSTTTRGELQLTGQNEDVVIVRENGTIEVLDTVALGIPLGLIDDVAEFIGRLRIHIKGKDTIVLMTSGVIDARNSEGEFFGVEKIGSIVLENLPQPLSKICDAIEGVLCQYNTVDTLPTDQSCILVRRNDE